MNDLKIFIACSTFSRVLIADTLTLIYKTVIISQAFDWQEIIWSGQKSTTFLPEMKWLLIFRCIIKLFAFQWRIFIAHSTITRGFTTWNEQSLSVQKIIILGHNTNELMNLIQTVKNDTKIKPNTAKTQIYNRLAHEYWYTINGPLSTADVSYPRDELNKRFIQTIICRTARNDIATSILTPAT